MNKENCITLLNSCGGVASFMILFSGRFLLYTTCKVTPLKFDFMACDACLAYVEVRIKILLIQKFWKKISIYLQQASFHNNIPNMTFVIELFIDWIKNIEKVYSSNTELFYHLTYLT